MRDFVTDDGRFSGRVLLKVDSACRDSTLGVRVIDYGNDEEWRNHVRFCDAPDDVSVDRVTDMLIENIFEDMELSWTRGLCRYIPGFAVYGLF